MGSGVSFRAFIERAFPAFNWYRYNELIVQILQDLLDGELLLPDGEVADKVFLHLRYQTGKSTYVALFCAYSMTRYPGLIIGVAMHNLKVARRFSKMVRAFYRRGGGRLLTAGIENWTCDGPTEAEQSEFWVCSVGSSPTGLPADVLIGDDLKASRAAANDPRQFFDDKDWLNDEFHSRKRVHLHMGLGRHLHVLINTRQGLADVASLWLYQGDFYAAVLPTCYLPETWDIGLPVGPFPVGEGASHLPETTVEAPNCTIATDWRKVGEGLEEGLGSDGKPLLPDITAAAFERRRDVNGGPQSEEATSSHEQGCPKSPKGGLRFHRLWTPYEEYDPKWTFSALCRAWDWASTEGGGDWSASALMGTRISDSLHLLLHACRARKDPSGVVFLMAAMAILDGREVTIALPQGQGDGKLTYAGMRNSVTTILNDVGAPVPPFRAMPVRTSIHMSTFRSAKDQRFSQPGGFAVTAKPQSPWQWADKSVEVLGSIRMCRNYPIWREDRAPMLSGQILELAKAACGAWERKYECEALNVCPGPGVAVALQELHGFGGFDGGADHYVDACSDAMMGLGSPSFGRPMAIG